MTVNAIDGKLFSALTKIDGVNLSSISAILGQTKASSGPVNPVTSGLQIEYYGGSLTGGNGAAISTWADISGNARDATQGTGSNQPTVVDPGLNGHPVALFDGSNDNLQYTNLTAPTALTYFAVMKCTGSGAHTLIAYNFLGDTAQWRIRTAKNELAKSGVASIGLGSTVLSTATFYTIAVTYSSPNAAFYLNGAADGTASSAQTFTNPLNALGRNYNGEYFQGSIAHAMYYNRVLNGTEITDVFNYLRTLWATW